MEQLSLTLVYVPLLGLAFSALTLFVVIQRRRSNIPYGDGDIPALRGAIRAHGNFIEYVPITVILIGLLEATGSSGSLVNGLYLTLVLARISHVFAMCTEVKSKMYFITRVFGAFTTWLIIVGASVLLLMQSL